MEYLPRMGQIFSLNMFSVWENIAFVGGFIVVENLTCFVWFDPDIFIKFFE